MSGTKGIEAETLARMSQVAAEEAKSSRQRVEFAAVSGPHLRRGAGARQSDRRGDRRRATSSWRSTLREALSGRNLRLYSSADLVGVELGGAVKNVIAIAAGVVTGLGLGHNTLAALITRGLHEMTRLGVACGGNAAHLRRASPASATWSSPAPGRCRATGAPARRWRTAVLAAEIERGQPTVAEGVRNSRTVMALARRRGVEMPITEQMEIVLYHGKDPRRAVEELMSRELKAEGEDAAKKQEAPRKRR